MKLTDRSICVKAGDAAYPFRLSQISDPPPVLHVSGDPDVLDRPLVAIVGTRRCTQDGARAAFAFAAQLGRRGVGVVSGLASGIDAAAHRGALSVGGVTIGVLASGLDPVYPREHAELAAQMIQRGAVVSEFKSDQTAQKFLFPRRNRIISGLALAVLVVEAPEKSGALLTANHAADQGREVFVPPVSLNNIRAGGIRKLMEDGVKVVTHADQILEAVQASASEWAPPPTAETPLSADAESILSEISAEPRTVDELSVSVRRPAHELLMPLTILEMAGRIRQTPGRGFVRA